jgi:DNA-binding transcriptional MerR regulator
VLLALVSEESFFRKSILIYKFFWLLIFEQVKILDEARRMRELGFSWTQIAEYLDVDYRKIQNLNMRRDPGIQDKSIAKRTRDYYLSKGLEPKGGSRDRNLGRDRDNVKRLLELGYDIHRISDITGLPLRTIRNWQKAKT